MGQGRKSEQRRRQEPRSRPRGMQESPGGQGSGAEGLQEAPSPGMGPSGAPGSLGPLLEARVPGQARQTRRRARRASLQAHEKKLESAGEKRRGAD